MNRRSPSRLMPRTMYRDAPQALLDRTRQLADLTTEYNVPLAALALQFSTRDPRIVTTVVGITHPERIDQTPAPILNPNNPLTAIYPKVAKIPTTQTVPFHRAITHRQICPDYHLAPNHQNHQRQTPM